MNRLMILVSVCAFFMIATSKAEEPSPYSVNAVASRKGDDISVSLTISTIKSAPMPIPQAALPSTAKQPGATTQGVVMGTVSETLSSPRITLRDGQSAIIMTGHPAPSTAGTQPADPSELESGTKVELISIKGQDKLLVVCTMIDNGAVIWADASTIPITPKENSDK